MTRPLLPRRTAAELARSRTAAVSAETLAVVAPIVEDVRRRGEVALRAHAERLGDLEPGAPLVLDRASLEAALAEQKWETRDRLERVAGRIRAFAQAQRRAFTDLTTDIPGGRAGHRLIPVARAGCYAPGGRHSLPSSVLMTAVTARAAGVGDVWVASPRPGPLVLAAAAVAGADAVLACGGAQAIAALVYGAGPVPPCDVVVGPGNRYVTAAKQLVSGVVGTDVPAGPSEVLVVADRTARPARVAAELLAQAEHDPDAVPMLIVLDGDLIAQVEAELHRQLATLPTAGVARRALANGGVAAVGDRGGAIVACEGIGPEHLALMVADPEEMAARNYGALFLGGDTPVALGDYGAGPNHVLPTGGTSRWAGGLSVLAFLRIRTWLGIDDPSAAGELVRDTAWLARAEGLEGHGRTADGIMGQRG
jgi:phosphoribosyl-ATP pyrophosphohydrolase/phosphoribosyl-AMP cyclohydrolase/histidinol dehydrogenase